MMDWIDYNSPTLGSNLCFGGICEYLIDFYNWYEGRAIQSFIDFIFGLLQLTINSTTESGKYRNELSPLSITSIHEKIQNLSK